MAGLPKKYAKMGFAKGWKAYRASKSRRRPSKSKPKIRRVRTMAKKRKSPSRAKFSLSPKDAVLYGAGYGIVREPINSGLKSLLGNVPIVGTLGDEVALGVLHWFGAKGNWFGMKKLFVAGLAVEAHNLGRNLAGGALSNLFGHTGSSETL